MPTETARAKRGRPPRDAAGRGSQVTLWLTPSERAHLESLGGTAQDGLRLLLAASLKRRRPA